MQTEATLPITDKDMESIMTLIPALLNDDEAGPAFFVATDEWQEQYNYDPNETT